MSGSDFYSNIDLNSVGRIVNSLDPQSAQDLATRAYVDAAIEGVSWKDSCRVGSIVNVTVASPGATIDGVTMATNDRVMLKNQTAAAENGIYIWNGAAVPMTRSSDMNVAAEVEQAVTTIEEGTNAGTAWRQTAVNVTLGTTSLAWTSFGTVAPGASETTAGIAEIATQAETDAGTDDLRIVTPLKLATYANRAKRFSATYGDGSATQYDITHNLGTKDVVVAVRRLSDDRLVNVTTTAFSTNVVRLNHAIAPASNAFRCTVIA